MGDLQFRFLVDHGLLPEHVLLDIACGSLRLGVRVIPFLMPGRYLGIDVKEDLIEHGKTVELGEAMCNIKQPEFVTSSAFEFEKFSKRPDYAIAQSLFSHLIASDITLCLTKLSQHRKDITVLYATFFEVDTPVANPPVSHPHGVYRYTRDEMADMGARASWRMDYIGNWNHPRGQKMLKYFVA